MESLFLTRLKFLTASFVIISLLIPFGFEEAKELKNVFPKRANYFLSWELSEETARNLAQWDAVVLDMEHQAKNADKIALMRQLNPRLLIFAYIAVQEIRDDALTLKQYTPLRAELAGGIKEEWWLRAPSGAKLSWWPGTHLLNITDQAPPVNGESWNGYLASFVSQKILGSGLWDGVFFDNTWNSLTEKTGANLDINGDGLAESRDLIENSYRNGLNNFFVQVRNLTANRFLLMGNDGEIYTQLNAMMFENFPYARGWSRMMRDYKTFPEKSFPPAFSLLNANTANAGGQDDYQKMRYGLASSLLGDGFYSFDLGDRDHGQIWWYDEYDFNLGEPVGQPYLAKNNTNNFASRGLWRRDFKQGLVLVNSGDQPESLDLNAEFEKIKGRQDPVANDGLIVSAITVEPQDGLILLRPLEKINNAFFLNGSFAKIFNERGAVLRNGFFAYDGRFKGGQKIFADEQTAETIVIDKNKIKIFKESGLINEFYPFSADFKGEISAALADLEGDGEKEIVCGMKSRGTQIKIFTKDGSLKKSFRPFPAGYTQGVNLAAGDLNGNGNKEIIVGLAKNQPLIRIFSREGRLLSGGFYAFPKKNKNGVNLAAGDVNGDGLDEIIAGAASGQPEIKIFNQRAKQIGRGFLGGSAKSKNGIGVAAVDLDNDGLDEIIALSANVFTTVLKR
ncbi:MAG: VCBS repeat-containing protein [Candidatus Magasanikbacteria bacterium]|nr:VCBS repeat-containing protein [Candidatus Magasanikbacteria bacterium]